MNVTPSLPASGSPDESPPAADRAAPARVTRPVATRRRLLEAGLALFAEKGPRDVTSHAIAAKAGYAAGTFYLHFKDKLALFRELAEEAASELEARLDLVARNRKDPAEITRAQAEALVGFAEDRRDLLRIVFHPGGEASEIGPPILERLARGLSLRRREALAGSGTKPDEGGSFDPEVLSQAIVGMWAHVLAWWAEDPSRVDRDAIIDTLTHFQLHGGCPEPGSPCRSVPSRPGRTTTSKRTLTTPEGEVPQ